jgi:hypothetical protein
LPVPEFPATSIVDPFGIPPSIRESRPGVPVDILSKIKVYNEGSYPYNINSYIYKYFRSEYPFLEYFVLADSS